MRCELFLSTSAMTIVVETKSESQTRIQEMGWSVLRIVIGFVILAAAAMKAHQLATIPTLGEGLLHAHWFNILVVEFELFFGIWLLVGLMPKVTWLVTIGCFAAFAGVSFYKAVTGEASCGCWGVVEVPPWIMVAFDFGVLGSLLIFRPSKRLLAVDVPKTNLSEAYWLGRTLLMTVILALVVTIQVYLFFGSFVGLERFMTAQEITFEIDKSFHSPEGDTIQIIVANKTSKPITLVGAKTGCKRGTIKNIPMMVLPHSQSQMLFVADEEADFKEKFKQKQQIVFFLDGGGTQKAVVELPLFEFLAHR